MHCFRERKAAFSCKWIHILWENELWKVIKLFGNVVLRKDTQLKYILKWTKSLITNSHVFVDILNQFQTESYIKMASSDQLKVNYCKVDVQKWKNLDDMIKKKYVIGTVTSMDLVKFASFPVSKNISNTFIEVLKLHVNLHSLTHLQLRKETLFKVFTCLFHLHMHV